MHEWLGIAESSTSNKLIKNSNWEKSAGVKSCCNSAVNSASALLGSALAIAGKAVMKRWRLVGDNKSIKSDMVILVFSLISVFEKHRQHIFSTDYR